MSLAFCNRFLYSGLDAARAIYAKRGFKLTKSEAYTGFNHKLVGETWSCGYRHRGDEESSFSGYFYSHLGSQPNIFGYMQLLLL